MPRKNDDFNKQIADGIRLEKKRKRQKLFKSGKSICKQCGYVGRFKLGQTKGSWFRFFLQALVGLPIIALLCVFSLLEGLLRLVTFSGVGSALWQTSFKKYIPNSPYKLKGCPHCGSAQGMYSLRSDEGKEVYKRFERDRFLID